MFQGIIKNIFRTQEKWLYYNYGISNSDIMCNILGRHQWDRTTVLESAGHVRKFDVECSHCEEETEVWI